MEEIKNTALRYVLNIGNTLKLNRKKVSDIYELIEILSDVINKEIVILFPEHSFVVNNQVVQKGEKYTWYIQPIDGRGAYFDFSREGYSTSLCIAENNNIIGSIVYAPETGLLYEAWEKSTLNGNPIAVKEKVSFEYSIVFSNIQQQVPMWREMFVETFENSNVEKSSLTLSLCEVASGNADVCIAGESFISGVLAGKYIVEKAGGRATTINGEDIKPVFMDDNILMPQTVCAGNNKMNRLFVALAKAGDSSYKRIFDEMEEELVETQELEQTAQKDITL